MPPLSSSSSSSWKVAFLGDGLGAPSFLRGAFPFFIGIFLAGPLVRGRSSSASTSPGVVNRLPHLGHLTFLPSGTGLAGRNTDLQSGQVIRAAMVVRPERICEGSFHPSLALCSASSCYSKSPAFARPQ